MTRARKETPILFSPEMILAEREGRKDQTRRVARVKLTEGQEKWYRHTHDTAAVFSHYEIGGYQGGCPQGAWGDPVVPKCPYGQAGDLLWVRERMRVSEVRVDGDEPRRWDSEGELYIKVTYEADGEESDWIWYDQDRLKHVPAPGVCLPYGGFREASRTTLELTEVRSQFLDQISIEDILAEGVQYPVMVGEGGARSVELRVTGKYPPSDYLPKDWRDYLSEDDVHHMMLRAHWGSLWDTINAKRGFGTEVNPVVWALTFKRHEGGKGCRSD